MNYKKIFISFAVSLFLITPFLAQLTLAQTQNYTVENAQKQLCPTPADCPIQSAEGIYNILAKIVRYVYTFFFVIALIFILLAAYNFLFARGDPTKIKSARDEILWALVAIAIALVSLGASTIVQNFISKPNG